MRGALQRPRQNPRRGGRTGPTDQGERDPTGGREP